MTESTASSSAAGGTALGGLLRTAAARFPASEFVFPGQRCTLAQLDRRADAFTALLHAAGVGPGDHVGVCASPVCDTVAALFGIFRAGAVAVPVSDRFRATELAYVLEHADLGTLLISPTCEPADLNAALPCLNSATDAELVLADAPRLRRIITLGEFDHPAFRSTRALGLPPVGTYPPVTLDRPPVESAEPRELAYLMYTSGTSAMPKACLITHAGSIRQGRSLAFDRYRLDASSAVWCPLPLFHSAGLATLTACLASGANFVHAGAFEPGQTLHALQDEQVTHAVPVFSTIWSRVLEHRDFPAMDLSRLRVVLMTGDEDELRGLQERLPQAAHVATYGMTEATGHLSLTMIDDPLGVRVTTGGFPLPEMQVRIVDPGTGHVLGPGKRGEIQFRGTSRCLGYYRDEPATADAIAPGGWFRSGDLGDLDTDGRLTFRGRLKDMLKVGGENVAALEVESYLSRHPAVNTVAVVGAPDSHYGEVPAAFVERIPGATVTEQELIEFCVDRIATFKVPRYVRFVAGWPMSATKIRKGVLRDQLAAELAKAGITRAPQLFSTRSRRIGG
ncbi:class I adenylate-forming enzyme family protein [Amycolatopsis pithecellobii]|uniref:AMP-binding protein n=1 Tax=Amycolatopsis pithecellobii TaxID=664692 RepID=A0A6N7Z4R1_9PSEU|nr:AMP-binding protein [Amycolatopsis pithecellobii]MTD55501.1 AMP-binding protein [Amycolatopsis pithecellobii]